MKSKDLKEKKKNKFKNPLSGISTKSLLITLFALLITFSVGFGFGYGCSAMNRTKFLTAYAATTTTRDFSFVNGSDTITFSLSYSPVAPESNLNITNDWINLPVVGTNFSLGSRLSSNLSQLFIVNGNVYVLQFPTDLSDVGNVPGTALNRFVSIERFIHDTDLNLVREWTIDVPFYQDSLFNPVFGTSFRSGSSVNPLEYGFSFGTLAFTNAPIQTNPALTEAISSYGNPSYVLPLYSCVSNRNPSYSIPRPPSQSITFDGLTFTFVFRFYFTSFSGEVLPSVFADCIVRIYTNIDNTLNSYNFMLFGVSQDRLLHYIPRDSLNASYQEGFNKGYNGGYQNGLQDGRAEKLEDITPWKHIVNGVNSFLNLQILPGVRISVILTITFGLILVGFLLKFYLGG